MHKTFSLLVTIIFLVRPGFVFCQKIFDTHIHGDENVSRQLKELQRNKVYKVAVSTSWDLQRTYQSTDSLQILHGLMLACPDGKVPYSNQYCFEEKRDFPDLAWVESRIKNHEIDFLGEVLSQYYGISPSDEELYPYYSLAEKHDLPVGIHTGLAGPHHGSPKFKVSLGRPILLEGLLQRFPRLRVWIMHAGAPFIDETLAIMSYYRNVYADISAISNPDIFSHRDFYNTMKRFIDAGLESRLMFGSDNGDVDKIIANINTLDFLSVEQREMIFYKNEEIFFKKQSKK